MMTTPKQKILNIISENRGLATILKDISDYATPGALMKVLKDEKKEFEKFHGLVNLIKYIYPNIEEEKNWMKEYAECLDVKKQTARYMLEYAEINGLRELKSKLIDKMIDCGNSTSRLWAKVYNYDREYLQGSSSLSETLDRLGSEETKIPELKIICKLLKSYCYLDNRSYTMIFETIADIEDKFQEIKDVYIKDLLYGRYLLLLIGCYVRQNNLELARIQCKKVITEVSNEYIVSMAYLHLGNSYIIENFDKAERYLKKGMLKAYGISKRTYEMLITSINFLYNVWNKKPMYLNHDSELTSDKIAIAFHYVNDNRNNDALAVLKSIDVSNINDNDKAFYYYISALIENNKKLYCKSLQFFNSSGDVYFKNLPLIKLKNMGIDEDIIELLAM